MQTTTFYQLATLAGGALLTVLLLLVGHWFNWPSRLQRTQAYSYGTAAIWCGFALWRFLNQDWITPAGLAIIALLGGAAVILAYRYDNLVRRIRQAQRAERNDRDLS